MHRFSRRAYVTSVAWLAGTGVSALILGGAMLAAPSSARSMGDGGLHALDTKNMYLGNNGCTGAGCHSGEAKDHSGRKVGDENTIWGDKDPHSKAFKNLTNEKGKKIATAMKIDDASKSAKCTVCHATDVPEKQRGPKFAKDLGKEGVSCEACHGAAEKWNDPHQKDGWTDGQRKDPAALAALGMIDTHDLAIRAKMCVSCHLQIDKDMLAAGHPTLDFEMYSYNNYKFSDKWQIHWDEHGGPGRKAQIWAVGQIAAADAAKGGAVDPALAKVFETGKGIVKDKFGSDDLATIAKSEPAADKIKAALDALIASADGSKAGKDNKHQRDVITSGVDALVSATNAKELPDAYIDAVEGAGKAEGDSWIAALKKMATFAK